VLRTRPNERYETHDLVVGKTTRYSEGSIDVSVASDFLKGSSSDSYLCPQRRAIESPGLPVSTRSGTFGDSRLNLTSAELICSDLWREIDIHKPGRGRWRERFVAHQQPRIPACRRSDPLEFSDLCISQPLSHHTEAR
jgi:hypothetical protein